MTTNKTVAKTFTIAQRTLTIATRPANGTITSNPSGINCGESNTTCSTTFDHGTSVTLTAAPKVGYELGTWGGTDCSSETNAATCTLDMTANKTGITKAFTAIQRTLTITKPMNGTITSNPGSINCGSGASETACSATFGHGTSVTLTATPAMNHVIGAWGGDDCSGSGVICVLTINANKTVSKAFIATGGGVVDTDGDGVADTDDVDDDNDGLIEVHDLDMFNHIRHNLAGTSYKTSFSAADNRDGAPKVATANCTVVVPGTSVYLCGYELATDLDFATAGSYESNSVNAAWRPNDQADASGNAATPDNALNPGFSGANNFASIFDGNGHTISNLYSRGGGNRGLFRSTTTTTTIRNVRVVDAHLYGGAGNDIIGALVGWNQGDIVASRATGGTINGGAGSDRVGGLVGLGQATSIIASYATGDVNGGAGGDNVGGLVGSMFSGTNSITASYATGAVSGGAGFDSVGGLVGLGQATSIIASYATGDVNGGAGGDNVGGLVGIMFSGTNSITASYATGTVNGSGGVDNIGGLVGHMRGGTNSITASYATGAVSGGAGGDNVGGLVGSMGSTYSSSFGSGTNSIIASYATGAVNGGDESDNVGGLVGSNYISSITASYAIGNVNGGAGIDSVGGLVGQNSGSIMHSYAFGSKSDGETDGEDGDAHPSGVTDATDLTSGSSGTGAGSEWDDASGKTKGAWDFGTASQAPALRYADYDGDMAGVDYCALFPAGITCGTTLLPGQRP